MAYDPLTAGDLVAGKPTKEEIFTKIRANQEQFNSDIQLLQGTFKIDIFDIKFAGKINQYSASEIATFAPVFKAPTGGSIVSAVITLLSPSTSGTLAMEIENSTDDGVTWNSVLTTPMTLTGTTTGSTTSSISFITDGEVFTQNELFRIRFTTAQVDQGEFHVSIYGELA